MVARRKTRRGVPTSFSIGQKVYILCRRKKSQTWTKRGTIRLLEDNKALVVWDHGMYGAGKSPASWLELTQLSTTSKAILQT